MRPAQPRWSTRVMVAILGGVLLTCGVLLAHRATRAVAVTTVAQPEAPAPAQSPARVVSTATAELPPPAVPGAATGESVPLQEPIPEPAALALEAPPPLATSRATTATASAEKPPPSPAELQAALRATPIVMYSTTWCGVCRRARQFLSENGLQFREIDADATPGGWEKVAQLSGKRAVPVIVVDGEVSSGLSPRRVLQSVASSMERRLGVRGISFQSAPPKG